MQDLKKMEGAMTLRKAVEGLMWNRKIEVLRIALGMTQAEAAEKCGTSQKVYWLWASGKSYPRNNSRKAISSAFGVSVSEIFNPDVDRKAG